MDQQDIGRRGFLLGATATVALAGAGEAATGAVPIIDTHIHLFDGTRPQGAPWLGSKAYAAEFKASLPAGYRQRAVGEGIVGAIAVEASGWVEDNLWLLETARTDPLIVGVVGRLDPIKADFADYLGRFRKDPLYRGIRYARFFERDGGRVTLNPTAVDNLKLLAEADLVLDSANPNMALLQANVRLSDAIPGLRQVVDHLPGFDPKPEERGAYEAVVRELAARPNIAVKLSQVYHPGSDGRVSMDYAPIQERLDFLLAAFGEDRVLFGSDFPNSYGTATIAQSVALMRRFYAGKSRVAAEKYFWRNSERVYKWAKRSPNQPVA